MKTPRTIKSLNFGLTKMILLAAIAMFCIPHAYAQTPGRIPAPGRVASGEILNDLNRARQNLASLRELRVQMTVQIWRVSDRAGELAEGLRPNKDPQLFAAKKAAKAPLTQTIDRLRQERAELIARRFKINSEIESMEKVVQAQEELVLTRTRPLDDGKTLNYLHQAGSERKAAVLAEHERMAAPLKETAAEIETARRMGLEVGRVIGHGVIVAALLLGAAEVAHAQNRPHEVLNQAVLLGTYGFANADQVNQQVYDLGHLKNSIYTVLSRDLGDDPAQVKERK